MPFLTLTAFGLFCAIDPGPQEGGQDENSPTLTEGDIAVSDQQLETDGDAAVSEQHVGAQGIDETSFRHGLRTRLGPEVEAWQVEVRGTNLRGVYEVVVHAPNGAADRRELTLVGGTDEQRARELAAVVTLWIESWDAEPPEVEEPEPESADPEVDGQPEAPAEATPPKVRGFIALGGRFAMAKAVDAELGPTVAGGVWLAKEHLQLRAQASWSRSKVNALAVDGIRFGAGFGVGSALPYDLWVGALAIPQAIWLRAEDVERADRWAFALDALGSFQIRHKNFLFGILAGIEWIEPAIAVRGENSRIAWGPIRMRAGLEIGARLP